MHASTRIVLFTALAIGGMAVAPTARANQPSASIEERAIRSSPTFLWFHPDIAQRRLGIKALEEGFPGDAMGHFKRAARYADKGSQAVIAEMYFDGIGVPVDRALGYAWMDLAAERGYPTLLAHRERYWARLSAGERERAVDVGQAIYAEFEDAVAQPRLERHLARGKRQATGSRVGMVGLIDIIPMDGLQSRGSVMRVQAGMRPPTISGHAYYADKYWEPRAYWEWQDVQWTAPRTGEVTVLPLRELLEGED